jgi:hypothetical protein
MAAQSKVDASMAGRERQILELEGRSSAPNGCFDPASRPKLYIGSRKLFHAPFDLEANGH